VDVRVFDDSLTLGRHAAAEAASAIHDAVAARGTARIIAATGASQFHFLQSLTTIPGVPWHSVELFHLDEYLGLAATHPASFRRYLQERLIGPAGIARAHLIDGEGDPELVCQAVGRDITSAPIDVAFVGIGENGHLAFNDPPADFETTDPYLVVTLDEACRRQQVGEGWFPTIGDVPTRALSMSIRQILAAREILAIVPDRRKAAAVKAVLTSQISPDVPASILRTHANTTLYLDAASASLVDPDVLSSPSA
jgi:glucosamine-6-phosphate deaminase